MSLGLRQCYSNEDASNKKKAGAVAAVPADTGLPANSTDFYGTAVTDTNANTAATVTACRCTVYEPAKITITSRNNWNTSTSAGNANVSWAADTTGWCVTSIFYLKKTLSIQRWTVLRNQTSQLKMQHTQRTSHFWSCRKSHQRSTKIASIFGKLSKKIIQSPYSTSACTTTSALTFPDSIVRQWHS